MNKIRVNKLLSKNTNFRTLIETDTDDENSLKEGVNTSYEADPLEVTLRKYAEEKTPIKADSPIIYTERKDGVLPGYNIKADKMLIAQEGMSKVSQTKIGLRNKLEKDAETTETQ